MGKKRQRHQNPQPFRPDDDDYYGGALVSFAFERARSKVPKHHQEPEKMMSSGISSKILREALLQRREIQEEAEEGNAFAVAEKEAAGDYEEEEREDIDDFDGFTDTESLIGKDYEEINEDDEKILEAFLSKNAAPERTLADVIINKIKRHDANVSSEMAALPKLDKSVIDVYKRVGDFLSKYTNGKMPKLFKHIPSMQLWEDILYLTEPENWSPNAMYQATRIFVSNLGAKKAERFCRFVLLPRVRDDIRKNKRLHFALYQALKKSLYKPAAFNKGILFPLCQSGTCNLREAVIVGSVIQKVSIPWSHSSVALLKLVEMEYCGTTSYFIKLLLDKKYALPYRVIDAVAAHFLRFLEDTRIMPVIWHQSFLAFVQRYKNELQKEDKDKLRTLVATQKHKLVTPEIIRELDNSRSRGEKEDDPMLLTYHRTIQEDRFDIPYVPMEDN